jgi:bifunctional non-homologous end joining protein LigD
MHPMLATPGPQPVGDEWVHEVKWDGMRVLADVSESRLRLFSRSGRDVTVSFPELAVLTGFVQDALLDGEIITLAQGVPSFAALSERMHVDHAGRAAELAESAPVTVMGFDLLRLYGVDLLHRPWSERRASLEKLELPEHRWRCSPSYDDGVSLRAATLEQGLEGVVAKRRRSTYQPGRRSSDWIKTANQKHQSCVVGGWRPEAGSPDKIGALLLGVPETDGSLTFCGRVGSGIGRRESLALGHLLTPAAQRDSPFAGEIPPLDVVGASWCHASVVVEVRHLGWTAGGRLRHPVYRGLRSDLTPKEVRRES